MEEKKERKTIKCSYAVLVIILFAALAFVTDYAFIERKTSKCDCPKCEVPNNEVISDNTDNTQVTDNQTYSYEDIAGYYIIENMHYYLYSDGTFLSESIGDSYGYVGIIGNYIIDNNKISLRSIFSYSSSNEGKIFVRPDDFRGSITIFSKNEIGTEDVKNGRKVWIKQDNFDDYKNKYEDLLKNNNVVSYSESILTSINPAANDAPGMAD